MRKSPSCLFLEETLEKSVAVTRELTVTASGRYPSRVHAQQAPRQGKCWSFTDRTWELMLRFYPFLQPFWERNYELGFFRNYVLFFLEENIPPLPHPYFVTWLITGHPFL